MAKCNCSGQTCGCRIRAGAGITVTGSGGARDEYVISASTEGGGGSGDGWDPGDVKETVRTDTPPGWLECNGQTVSRTAYAELFAAIGTRWGAGDGFSTFNVPPFGGRTRIGAGPGYTLGGSGGTDTTTLTQANLPPHQHTIGNHQHDLSNHTHSDAHEHGSTGTESNFHSHGLAYKVDTANNTETKANAANRVTDVKIGAGDKNAATGNNGQLHTHPVPPWGGRTDGPSPNLTSVNGAQATSSVGQGAAFTNLPPYRVVRVLIHT